jgi:uncharacterized protein YhbP (UPF0306 family)
MTRMKINETNLSENQFPEEIRNFIRSHHAMSIAVCHEGKPWSATCYYAFDEQNLRLIFVSDVTTKHIQGIMKSSRISGTISNDERNVLLIQGIQFTGEANATDEIYTPIARNLFLKKFPIAVLKKLTLWQIEIDYVKMTDNKVLFAAKTHWKRIT